MKYKILMIAMAALTLWGCSSSDDEGNEGGGAATFQASSRPNWMVDMFDDQEAPQWTSPDPAMYENKMIVLMRLQEELVPYSTDDDQLAVFVGDECRAFSRRSGTDQEVYFVINLHGNNTNVSEFFTMKYYSGGLHQLFTVSGMERFLNEVNVGLDREFAPMLMNGSTKYPVKTKVTLNPTNPDKLESMVSENDRVAVFVSDECRGVGKLGEAFTVFSFSNEEKGQLRYYNQKQEGIFTVIQPIALKGEDITCAIQL